jgi:DNA segregation ATPase FtsK/SpoIIIE-like protein
VTTAAPTTGGIGLPEDSPFHDEFFASDAGWPYASSPSAAGEGPSAAGEIAARYVETPRAAAPAPAVEPVAQEAESAFEDELVSFDDVLVSRLPESAFDDFAPLAEQVVPDAVPETMPEAPVAPAPTFVEPTPVLEVVEAPAVEETFEGTVEETVETPTVAEVVAAPEPAHVVAASVEPAPQLSLFAEPAMATATMEPAPSAVAAPSSVDLSRLHAMELDPLFHDAVNAVLERERASAVVLQRQLGIGYARGIRILDQMTNAGLVGPDTPTGARQIRVTRDAWKAFAS